MEVLDAVTLVMFSSSVEEESVDTMARLLMFEHCRLFLCRVATARLAVSSFVICFTFGEDINFESIVLQNEEKKVYENYMDHIITITNIRF